MAKIDTFPPDADLTGLEKFLTTDTDGTTKNIILDTLKRYVLGGFDDIEESYQDAVPLITQGDAEAGTNTGIESWSALRVAQAIAALAGGGGTWGSITGTLSTQTDLQGELDARVDLTTAQNIDGSKTFYSDIIIDAGLGGVASTQTHLNMMKADSQSSYSPAQDYGSFFWNNNLSLNLAANNGGTTYNASLDFITNLTSNRTYIFPDADGTFALGGGTATGSNTGDQTSIVGITGTKAQFDTAVTDGDILYVGDAISQDLDMADNDIIGANDIHATGTDIVFRDSGTQSILRVLDYPLAEGAWNPNADSSFFQFGRPKVQMTSEFGAKLDAASFYTDGFLLTDTIYTNQVLPDEMLVVEGNIRTTGNFITSGLVDGIDIATDVAANTAKVGFLNLTGDVTSVGAATTIAVDAVDVPMISATGTPDATTFYRGDNTWSTPAGSGDMVLATVQTITGAKTFDAATLLLNDTDSAFDLELGSTSTITSANKTLTFDVNDGDRTLTVSGDATVTGTNTGDQTSIVGITGTFAQFDAAITDESIINTFGTPAFAQIAIFTDANTVQGVAGLTYGSGTLLVSSNVEIDNGNDLKFNGATSGQAVIETQAVAGTPTLTLPTTTDTLVGKATTDIFTNKTIDVNGTGNDIQHLPVDWVIPVGNNISNVVAATDVVSFTMPFAMTVTDIRMDVLSGPVGSVLTVDVHIGGTSIMTTDKLVIDAGEYATETLTLSANAANTNTCTIDGKVYTFQATLTDVDGNVHIGASASDTIDNLIAAINLGGGAGTDYADAMTLHSSCNASEGSGDTMDLAANVAGTGGNSIAVTENNANMSWGSTPMSGGVATETSTETAATGPTITDTTLEIDTIFSVDIDTAGSSEGGIYPTITLKGYRT